MTTHSSSTADATSEVSKEVQKVLRQAADEITEERADRITTLIGRIQSLEHRGFIKRQQFSAPTTGDFERRFASMQKG